MKSIICPYCDNPATFATGKEIYPYRKDLYSKNFWRCEPCGAYVGCHKGTDKPLGRLANKELRDAKIKAHSLFDPLWKEKKMSRTYAYKWLSERLNIDTNKCHIGMFDVEMCNKVIEILSGKHIFF